MTVPFKKIGLAGLAALTLGLSFSTPAAAWYRGYGYGGGYNPGAAAAAGLIGGLALGAVAASAANRPYYAEPAGDCWIERRRVYDQWGNYIGHRRIRVCE
ncbi:hypothetical protein K9U39_13275 [Rhodoblastus acidophilus]|uniref:Lectin-like protein BA14k n=1 Tax=Candidatus Rhodoblastus alkanivorans TaxID=2954117 RepID=A0ABS9ZAK3_9HYPH|nr:hypothetical protein [Candidatus Rhodoblastus alkanivorans]MCI4677229.1 hypothetical protein [Candidatus Rhodoblastus alkanivorans]MCI4684581.1 hypothetical protein [Candidatus Rhodoblastus alkanivorans]MDI4641903.1 hypothetical protein [Rhodoblastus acidophilus]